jgi:hypothetical protein
MTEEMAELVTHICKECERQGLTLEQTLAVFAAVVEFQQQNKREG